MAASKEVRDAFRRHVASAGESLAWDVEAAGIPSALTPEMEAQQAAKQVHTCQPHEPCRHLPARPLGHICVHGT